MRQKDEQAARTAVRSESRKHAAGKKEGEGAQRATRREAAAREGEDHRLEARVRELTVAVADPALYAGAAEGARKAGRLDRELKEAKRALDDAMARWTEAVEALDALAALPGIPPLPPGP